MRNFVIRVMFLLTAALVIVGVSSAGTVRGITPVTLTGKATCSSVPGLTYSAEVKFSPPVHGASADGLYIFVESNVVGWYVLRDIRDVTVRAAIVKGGTSANVYVYPGGDYSDGGLQAPLNPKNGKPYAPGYVIFCYDLGTP